MSVNVMSAPPCCSRKCVATVRAYCLSTGEAVAVELMQAKAVNNKKNKVFFIVGLLLWIVNFALQIYT